MFVNIKLKQIDGVDSGQNLILFGLTTCGYCKKAMEYLNNTGYEFKYAFLDEFPPAEKQDIKNKFKEEFNKRMSFPTLLINDDYLAGFTKYLWDSKINKNL